jgi:hypothetical protein
MAAGRIPNPRREGSIPSTDAFVDAYGRRIEELTTGYAIAIPRAPGEYSTSARGERAVGQRPGHLIWDEGNGSSNLPSSTRRPQHAQLPAERAPQACPAPEIRSPSGAGRNERPWLNWRERLPTKQEVAGSSPAGRAVSEAEGGDAPGCGPGGSGFEPRRTPQQHPVLRAAAASRGVVRA